MSKSGSSPAPRSDSQARRRVALLTLGCVRNEVDSEELAGRLATGGWDVTTDGTDADLVLVNTCGFIEQAKQESIDTLLAAADTGAKVVATGCLAERYGAQLADSLPEADAVLGFDHYPDIAARLDDVLAGSTLPAHTPRDRRALLPVPPVARGGRPADRGEPEWVPPVIRRRLDDRPVAPLKLATGCDRRCAFCAIPMFRGAFVSRPPEEILAEASWLADQGVSELVLVSENSTSYGKDLRDQGALERLLPRLAAVPGVLRIRVSYLQPAEIRPGLIEAIAGTPGVAPYFDLSFQHASESVLRRMRRFGSTEQFLKLIDTIRGLAPEAGIRTNVIVGFPGETAEDVSELEHFLGEARLDAVGVFQYSDEDGTEAATLPDQVPVGAAKRRFQRVSHLAEQVCSQRAADRLGQVVEVLVDTVEHGVPEGRAAHQAPEVDGTTTLASGVPDGPLAGVDPADLRPGDLVRAVVADTSGVDLVAVPLDLLGPAGRVPR